MSGDPILRSDVYQDLRRRCYVGGVWTVGLGTEPFGTNEPGSARDQAKLRHSPEPRHDLMPESSDESAKKDLIWEEKNLIGPDLCSFLGPAGVL